METAKTKHQKTLKLLLISHSLCTLLLLIPVIIIAVFLRPVLWNCVLGLVIGGLGGVVLILSMSYSIQRAITKDAQSAQKYMLKHYAVRLLVMLALLLIGIFNDRWLLPGIAGGLFCVKISGFLVPQLECRVQERCKSRDSA